MTTRQPLHRRARAATLATVLVALFAQQASAAPYCSVYTTPGSAKCAVVNRGYQTFAYPKLDWQRIGSIPLSSLQVPGRDQVTPSANIEGLARPSALAQASAGYVGVDGAQVAGAAQIPSDGAPVVLAQYSEATHTLVVDIVKIQREGDQAVMYRTRFEPAHGQYWRAQGAYISPTARAQGGIGADPFAAFNDGSDVFVNIAFPAAMTVVGHAQRMAQAPTSVVAFNESSMSQKVTKKKSLLKTKITTEKWFYNKPRWFVGMPALQANSALALQPPPYCVSNPTLSGSSCAWWDAAKAGVAFQEQQGGDFPQLQDLLAYDKQTKSSINWGVIVGIALAGFDFGASLALLGGGAALGTAITANNLTGNNLQSWGNTYSQGYVNAASTDTAGAMSGALLRGAGVDVTRLTGLGGADFSGGYNSQSAGEVAASATAVPAGLSDGFARAGVAQLRALSTGPLATTTPGVRAVMLGNCGLNADARACGSQGYAPRANNLTSFSYERAYSDNGGVTLRTSSERTP